MRKAGRVVAEMHDEIHTALRPGVSTLTLDMIGRKVLERRGATSNFLGYHGFPGVICASPNDLVVHGIPSAEIVLEEGDLIAIDCGAIVEGWHGDAAFTAGIGEISADHQRLIEVADRSLDAAIAAMVEGNQLGDIGWAVQSVVEGAGYSLLEGYSGHGIGTAMHEEPSVYNHGKPGTGTKLRVGNVLAIEPMLTMGSGESVTLEDEWSVVTTDGSWSAHVEHTVSITDNGPEVLTRL